MTNNTWVKYAVAGVVGALVFTVITGGALLLTDSIFIRCIAGLAGIFGAYLSFQFGDVLRAIPPACAAVLESFAIVGSDLKRDAGAIINAAKNFLRAPHPLIYSCLVLGFGVAWWLTSVTPDSELRIVGDLLIPFCVLSAIFYCCAAVVLWSAAAFGQEYLKENTQPEYDLEKGSYGYATFFKWVGIGIGVFFLSRLWRAIGVGLKKFFRLVHSSERLMVAVDGPFAGLVSMGGYAYFNHGPVQTPDCVLVLVFAGILGAAFMLINVKYVAPKFGYHFLPQRS